jgi:hypothetical protein
MKVVFVIDESDVFNSLFEVSIKWDCPFLPRQGEFINPDILMKELTTQKFYEKLTEKAKKEWYRWVKNKQDYYGSYEKAEEGCMSEWLLDMKMCVKEVTWDMDTKGCFAVIGIEESRNIWE